MLKTTQNNSMSLQISVSSQSSWARREKIFHDHIKEEDKSTQNCISENLKNLKKNYSYHYYKQYFFKSYFSVSSLYLSISEGTLNFWMLLCWKIFR